MKTAINFINIKFSCNRNFTILVYGEFGKKFKIRQVLRRSMDETHEKKQMETNYRKLIYEMTKSMI